MAALKKLLFTFTILTLSFQTTLAQGEASNVSEKMLNKFISVQPKIGKIATSYEEELEGVKDTSKAQAIQTKYNGQMVEAIKSEGMSAQEYNTVSNAINSNPDTRERYMNKIQ
jgi:hypothetical protein